MSSSRWIVGLVAAVATSRCVRTGDEVEVPGDEEGRRGRRLPRHQGRRPVPLARRRRPQVEGRRRLGRGRRTRSPTRYLEVDPRARGDQEAAHRAVELREVSPPRSRTAAGTSSPRTTACRTRTSSTCRTRSTASREMLLDPNTLDARTAPSRWPGSAVSDDGKLRSPTASPRPAPTGTPGRCSTSPPARRSTDELKWVKFSGASWTHGRQGLLLQPLPRAARRAPRSRASTSTRSSTTTRSARRRARTCSSTSGPTSRSGASAAASPRTAGTSSSPSATAPPAARTASSTRT